MRYVRTVANTRKRGAAASGTQREKVMEMLHQLEPHAASWVKAIRAYILKLEAEGKRS